ncbi:hypothetical protein A4U53_016465 [Rhizobium ruizarguesonis]|uniref:Uncharacterized protein n=1 Tax=Rhizobium ruizarguesonis TaxID=2081791 RepID=A0ACD5ES91_9HYPH
MAAILFRFFGGTSLIPSRLIGQAQPDTTAPFSNVAKGAVALELLHNLSLDRSRFKNYAVVTGEE